MLLIKNGCRIALLLVIFFLAGWAYWEYFAWWQLEESGVVRISMAFGALLLVGPLIYFMLIAILGRFCYREPELATDAELPVCTVVIPAYNEGAHILAALRSILDSDYPAEKLEIIAVDDGSIDDTWRWMTEAAAAAAGRIRLIRSPRNQGKRHALYCGFQAGRGEVLISVDSDSVVRSDALRRMVSPLVRDGNVGAVSGNVRVVNLDNGVFPPMIDVGFTFSFEFIRAGQSAMQSVFCTPGALSAYRRRAIEPVLEQWLNQTFLGKPAGIGEDRAMTNLILAQGFGVVLARSALVATNVPESYRGITRMLLRWERSNIRENLAMYAFIFRIFHWRRARSWFQLFTLLQYTQMTLTPVLMLWITLYNIVATEGEIIGSIVLMVLLWATLPAVVNLRRRSTKLVCFCYVYAIFHLFTLFWIVPYAFVTVRNSNWLTRMCAGSNGKI